MLLARKLALGRVNSVRVAAFVSTADGSFIGAAAGGGCCYRELISAIKSPQYFKEQHWAVQRFLHPMYQVEKVRHSHPKHRIVTEGSC
jgi:hypothetical protein